MPRLFPTLILTSIFLSSPAQATFPESLLTLQEALIYVEEGAGDISGTMELVERALRESTEGEAANNPVFLQIAQAAEAMQDAQATGAAKDLATAKAEIADAGVTAAEEIDKNPALDQSTRQLNEADKNAFTIARAAAEAEVKVAELNELREAALVAGDTEATAAVDAALGAIQGNVEALREQARHALETVTAEETPDEAGLDEMGQTAAAAPAAVLNIIEVANNTPGIQEAILAYAPESDPGYDPGGIDPGNPPPTSVPEPSTIFLLVVGLLGLARIKSKRE